MLFDNVRRAAWHVFVLASTVTLWGCAAAPSPVAPTDRQKVATAMFQERCKKAGEFIKRTVDDVDGILVLRVRPVARSDADQFALTDPYGKDYGGEAYVHSFLRGFYSAGITRDRPNVPPEVLGYKYVDVVETQTRTRFRYTGQVQERASSNPVTVDRRFIAERHETTEAPPRYGITYDDISTREEREYWIAGSSLKILDLQTNEVIAERIGYAMDFRQGSRAGARSPWLFSLDHACPAFKTEGNVYSAPAFAFASGQAARFAERVLKPAKD